MNSSGERPLSFSTAVPNAFAPDSLACLIRPSGLTRRMKSGEAASKASVMTKNVVSCEPGRSLTDAVEMMNANGIRHLVIGRAGKVEGVISLHDITRHVERTSNLYEI